MLPKSPKMKQGLIGQKLHKEIDCKIRGFSPLPAAWTMFEGMRHKILMSELTDASGDAGVAIDDNLTIGCGKGAIRILHLQREGKPAINAADFQRASSVETCKKRLLALLPQD